VIIDIHAHSWVYDNVNRDDLILKVIEKFGIDKIYISNVYAPSPTEEEVGLANKAAETLAKSHPEHIGAFLYLSPEHQNALDVLKRGIEDQGFEGVKFWLSTFCDDMVVNKSVERIIDYGVPLLIHSFHKSTGQMDNESIGVNVANLAKRYPELKIIMAHLGGNCYNGIPAIRDCKNVWVDISSSIYRADDLNYTVENIGVDRVLFGTDCPIAYSSCIGQVLEADLTNEEKDRIFYKNALKVLDRSFRL